MSTMTLLTLISALGAIALFVALAILVRLIAVELECIGGERPDYGVRASLLSKIRMGVRAIESETGMLAPEVTRLNAALAAVANGVVDIDKNLGGVIDAVTRQGGVSR